MKFVILACFLVIFQFTVIAIPYVPQELLKNDMADLAKSHEISAANQDESKASETESDFQVVPAHYENNKEDNGYIIGDERRKMVKCKYGYDALGDCLKFEEIFY
ncbi:hypothetical protein QE152_g36000 [Popillia japonica]|uniref:Uncharacterized protein n=1 Tax=Popillia japonica TaxID=7064 RepID=A0AAW1IEH9_POPJA